MQNIRIRPRRLRQSQAIRNISQENTLTVNNLIYPLFLIEGENVSEEIKSMPGKYRLSLDNLLREIENSVQLGIKTFAIFPVVSQELKNENGSEALNPDNLLHKSISIIKKEFPDICLITDIALDPYTSHGHDGLLSDDGLSVLNDETVNILSQMAILQAEAGADIVAPSDMMDGRIGAIRDGLDSSGYSDTLILSYAAKYASAFYGPFRDALSSSPKSQIKDKKTYQMDYSNSLEADREILLDLEEGADMIMIKPGLSYLDIVRSARDIVNVPLIAYSVSGEYSMIKAASQNGWLNEKEVVLESLTSFVRAGANAVITYYAPECAQWLKVSK